MYHSASRFIILIMLTLLAIGSTGWAQSQQVKREAGVDVTATKPLVTFVELGSVKCIPCRQMQPVMKAIEEKYGPQVKVVFYDVWKPEQREYGTKYGVRVIPTQVFLDTEGKEFFRHEGFYPETAIDKLLQQRGLTARSGG